MFDAKAACFEIRVLLEDLDKCICESDVISSQDVTVCNELKELVNATCDHLNDRYQKNGDWADKGYLTARTALVHTLRASRKTVSISLSQGELLSRFECVRQALYNNKITRDHSQCLIPLLNEKYIEFFDDDVNLLIENAQKLSAEQFSYVVHHWKNMVDAIRDEPSDEYQNFINRKLFLSQISDDRYIISGELDIVTGKILDKALKNISQQLWREQSPESRSSYTLSQQRADAIGYLAQGYVSKNATATSPFEHPGQDSKHEIHYTPAISSDVIIDIEQLDNQITTRQYLLTALKRKPLERTHSPATVKQLLCDTIVGAPIRHGDGRFDLGRTTRTVPSRLKKQLVLSSSTCSIDGCSTPSAWCDAHHIHHWADGGKTNIDNLMLLCRRHHTMIHHDQTFAEKIKASPPNMALTDSG